MWAAIKVYKAKKVIEEADSPSSVSMSDTPSDTPASPEWVDDRDRSLETQPEEVPPSPKQSLETQPEKVPPSPDLSPETQPEEVPSPPPRSPDDFDWLARITPDPNNPGEVMVRPSPIVERRSLNIVRRSLTLPPTVDPLYEPVLFMMPPKHDYPVKPNLDYIQPLPPDPPKEPEPPNTPAEPEPPNTPAEPEPPNTPAEPEPPNTPAEPEPPNTPAEPEPPNAPAEPELEDVIPPATTTTTTTSGKNTTQKKTTGKRRAKKKVITKGKEVAIIEKKSSTTCQEVAILENKIEPEEMSVAVNRHSSRLNNRLNYADPVILEDVHFCKCYSTLLNLLLILRLS